MFTCRLQILYTNRYLGIYAIFANVIRVFSQIHSRDVIVVSLYGRFVSIPFHQDRFHVSFPLISPLFLEQLADVSFLLTNRVDNITYGLYAFSL